MASNSCSYRNTQQVSTELNQSEEVMVEIILTPSNISAPCQAPVSVPRPTLYTQKDLKRITKLCMDLFL